MPPKTSPAVTRSKTPARQTTTAKAAPAPPQEPQPEQVYAGLFGGGGGAFGSNFGNLSGSYGTPTGSDQADARLESLEQRLLAEGARAARERAADLQVRDDAARIVQNDIAGLSAQIAALVGVVTAATTPALAAHRAGCNPMRAAEHGFWAQPETMWTSYVKPYLTFPRSPICEEIVDFLW